MDTNIPNNRSPERFLIPVHYLEGKMQSVFTLTWQLTDCQVGRVASYLLRLDRFLTAFISTSMA